MVRHYKRKGRQVRPIRVEGDVAYVTLTRGCEAVIDVSDVPLVAGRNWCCRPTSRTGYAWGFCVAEKRNVAMHRVIMNAPDGLHVDHINGDGLDNRRSNLRLATPSQNCQNIGKRKTNTSGFKGVCSASTPGKWVSHIRSADKSFGCNGKIYLGTFDTPEEASFAYREASARLHGEYSRT